MSLDRIEGNHGTPGARPAGAGRVPPRRTKRAFPAGRLAGAAGVLVLLALFLVAGCGEKPSSVTTALPPIDTGADPLQETVRDQAKIRIKVKTGFVDLLPVARYRIAAAVASKRKYTAGWGAEVMPFDLALVWGRLTDPEVAKRLEIKHDSTRLAWFRVRGDAPPVTFEYAMSHGSNNHLVPATENLYRAVDGEVKIGDRVVLEGYLVNGEGLIAGRAIRLKTSLTREDTDRGACEILYVTSLRVGDRVYR